MNQTVQQLNLFHVDGQYTEIRTIKDGEKPHQRFFNGNVEEAINWLDQEAQDKRHIYFGVNPRSAAKGDKASVTTVIALYSDLDLKGEGISEAMTELLNIILPPNYVVFSGRGLHAYWLIEPSTDKELWRRVNVAIQRQLAHLKADEAVSTDEARILRLVPYPNLKNNEPTRVMWDTSNERYTLEQVAAAFHVPVMDVFARDEDEGSSFGDVLLTGGLGETLLRRYVAQGTPGNRHNAGVDLACQLRDNRISYEEAQELMVRYTDLTDYASGGYNHVEALKTLDSVYKTPAREPWAIRVPEVEAKVTADVEQFIIEAKRTDAGAAEIFEALYGEDVRFNNSSGEWNVWNGVYWEPDKLGKAHQRVIQMARTIQLVSWKIQDNDKREALSMWGLRLENTGKRKAVLETAQTQPGLSTVETDYDRKHFLASVKNGTLNLITCELQEPQREDYITKTLGTSFDPNADCPRWKQFMQEIFNGNQNIISFIQRAIGYTLTGDTREQVLFLMHGGGRNGKSRFLETLMSLLHDYGNNTSFETFDASGRSSNSEYTLAALKGGRFVSIIETEEDKRLNEAKAKSVTGQDTITARHIYGSPFNYKPEYKVWIAMNHKPIIRGTDDGIWRRIMLIPFTQSFKGREDQTLDQKLEAELPGILNWALEGLKAWHQQGLNPPPEIRNAGEEYRSASDIVAQWIEECCVVGEKSMVAGEAFSNFRLWLKSRGERDMSQTLWGRRMSERGFEDKRKTINKVKVTVYEGIRLDSDAPAFGKEWA